MRKHTTVVYEFCFQLYPFTCTFHSFISYELNDITWYKIYCIFVIHLYVGRHLSSFQFLAVLNRASVIMDEQVSLYSSMQNPIGIHPGIVQLGLGVNLFPDSQGIFALILIVLYIFTPTINKCVPLYLHLCYCVLSLI